MSTQIAKTILSRLKGMINKPYMYKGRNITITAYHVLGEEGKTQIDIENGDGEPLPPIKTDNLAKFIDQCLEVDDSPSSEMGVSVAVVKETNSILTKLQETLLDNIEQVKKNPGYIKQANVINSSANSLIGLAKLHIQVNKIKRS